MIARPHTNHRAPIASGFVFIEALAAIAILAAFALIATEVAVAALRVPAQAAGRENGLLTEAGTMERLRQDVWSATKIDVEADGTSVSLQTPQGTKIRWSISKQGILIAGDPVANEEDPADASMRIDQHKQSSTMTWKSFAAHSAGLELRGERTGGDFGEHVTVLTAPFRIGIRRRGQS